MHFLPWWLLVACLAASAFATYLLLARTQAGDSRWALAALTAVLAPVVLAGTAAAAISLSTLLSVLSGDGPAVAPVRPERTGAEATPEATGLAPPPERTTPEASPEASPGASPSASPAASPSLSAGARTPR